MTTVNLTEFFPCTFLLHLIRALITFNVVHSILKNKYNTAITFAAIVTCGMIYSYITVSMPSILNRATEIIVMLGYYFMMLIILILVTNGKLFSKLFATIFSLIIYLISTTAFSVIITSISISDLSILTSFEIPISLFFIDVLFIFSFSFIFIALIRFIKNKNDSLFEHKTKYIFFFLFPITHIFSSIQTYSSILYSQNSDIENFIQSKNIETIGIIFAIICMILDFSIIFIIDHFEKIEEENLQKEREILKNTINYHQMLMLKEEKQEFRKIKHDFANIITTAKGFIEIDKPEKALSILSNTNEDLMGLAGFSVCSNETINTILYIKQQQAERNNIKLTVEISEEYPVLIEDYDLCRILHNIIDNSLNAVSILGGEKHSKISIDINEKTITIKSENKYNNNAKIKKSYEHGNGIGIIKSIAQKYGGKYASNQSDGVWYVETFLGNKKPADSTPPRILG